MALTYDLLVVPGTAFMPDDRRTFRVSISNLDRTAVADLAERLAGRRRASWAAGRMLARAVGHGADVGLFGPGRLGLDGRR